MNLVWLFQSYLLLRPVIRRIGRRGLVILLLTSTLVGGSIYNDFYTDSIPDQKKALAAVDPSGGRLFYGDTDNAGVVKFQTYTNVSAADSWSSETSSTITPTASNIQHVTARHAPTRDEIFIGTEHSSATNTTIAVTKCIGGCDASGDFTGDTGDNFTISSGAGTYTCDTGSGSCVKHFDLAYEQLSSEALFVMRSSTSGQIEYCTFDGSSWSGSNCSSPSTQSISGMGGTAKWILLIPKGGAHLTGTRTNEILVLFGDTANDLFATIWDGSSFTNTATMTTTMQASDTRSFDGAWETTSGQIMVVWGDATGGTTNTKYKTYVPGTGWDGSESSFPASGESQTARWIDLDDDPKSDQICAATLGNGDGSDPYIWDGSTTWTKGNSDPTSGGGVVSPYIACAWEKFNGGSSNSAAIFVRGDRSTTADISKFQTWVQGTGFSSDVRTGSGNAAAANERTNAYFDWGVVPNPNNDQIMVIESTYTTDLEELIWKGTATDGSNDWQQADYLIDPAGTVAGSDNIPPDDATGNDTEAWGYNFMWIPYNAWQRNWRFYSGSDLASLPTTDLEAENTAPSGITSGTAVRLRLQYAERAGLGQTNARKKLQYVSAATCSDPNSCANTNWTDVDDTSGSGIWRYKDLTCSSTDCADGTLLTGTVLTGSDASCTAGNGCGTWVLDKDAAAAADMDHNALKVQESEYIIENNSAAASTTYYFRLFDVDQQTPIFREQDSSDCGPSSNAACAYPSLSTTTPSVDEIHYRWRSDDGNETTGTNLVDEDTLYSGLAKSSNIRLRFTINNSGGSAYAWDFRLDWAARVGASCDTDESYAAVPDSPTTEHFDMTTTSNYANGDASTNVTSGPGVMTDPGGSTFAAGKLIESTSNSSGSFTLKASRFTEFEFNFQANSNATDSGNYCFRLSNAGSTTNITFTRYAALTMGAGGNSAPNTPTSLVQKRGDTSATISTGGWINTASVIFEGSVTDPDTDDQVALCVEKDTLGTSFASTNGGDACGSFGAEGTRTVTIGSLSDGEYHWQAQGEDDSTTYSSWQSYPTPTPNAESERDFGVDTVNPTAGTVNDGSGADVDSQTDMTQLDGNWSGFSDALSGVQKYEYKLLREVDTQCWNAGTNAWASCDVYNDVGTSTSFTVTHANLALRTSTRYIITVRVTDNAGNTASASSDGLVIAVSLAFGVDSTTVSLPLLQSSNNFDATATTTLNVQTNAYNGYTVYAFKADLLRHITFGSTTIADVADSGCSGSAVVWPGATNFGFTSSDDIDSNKFNSGGTRYCAFPSTGSGNPGLGVADRTSTITGSAVNENHTITYRAQVTSAQTAGEYRVSIIYTVVATY